MICYQDFAAGELLGKGSDGWDLCHRSVSSVGGDVLQDEDMDEQQEMERKLRFVAKSQLFCESQHQNVRRREGDSGI